MTGWPPLIDVCFVACLGPNGLTIIEVLMGAPEAFKTKYVSRMHVKN